MPDVKTFVNPADYSDSFSPAEYALISLYASKPHYKLMRLSCRGSSAIFFVRRDSSRITGSMGFMKLENDPEAFNLMLNEGISFCRQNNADRFYAPMNFNTWYDYRLISGNADNEIIAGEKGHPAFYTELFLKSGFEAVENYYTYMIDKPDSVIGRFAPIYGKFIKQEYAITDNADVNDPNTLRTIYDISADAFSKAFLYDPIAFEEFAYIYRHISSVKNSRITAAVRNGQIEGYLYTLFTDNLYVLKTIAVRSGNSGGFTAPSLIYEAYVHGLNKGIKRFAHAYMREGISTHNFSKRHGYEYRKYTLYCKDI